MIKVLHHLNFYFVVVAFFIAGIYLLDPYPYSWGTDNKPILKYLPVFIINISIFFNIFFYITSINRSRFAIGLFLILMFFGSCYSLLLSGNSFADSFMGRSLNSLTFINFVSLLHFKRYVTSFRRIFLYMLALYSLWMFVLLILQQTMNIFELKHIFHEEIFIVTSSSILFFLFFKSYFTKIIFSFISISCGFLSFKLTGFVCSFLAIFFLSLAWWHINGKQKLNRRVFIIFNYTILLLLSTSIGYFLFDYLPSGSPSVRLVTYLERFMMFLDSPIYGVVFTGSPILQHAWLVIPSHSDFLDILAFGGLASLFLFLYYPIKIIISLYRNYSELINKGHYFLIFNILLVISFLFVCTFNPVMHQPKLAIFFWFSLSHIILNASLKRHNL
tara:strand:+ start:1739 stop:2902 length:1164 start_codon:yes stop_codon:yes gene_type:complete